MIRYPNRDLVATFPLRKLMLGETYTSGYLFTGVSDTNAKQLVVENTSSDTAILLFEPTVRGSGQIYTSKIKNPIIDTAGDAAEVVNRKTDDTDTTVANVTTAGDNETGAISGGTSYPSITAGSGSNRSNADPGASGETNISDILMPDDTLAIEASNQSGSTQDISIAAIYIEYPEAEL